MTAGQEHELFVLLNEILDTVLTLAKTSPPPAPAPEATREELRRCGAWSSAEIMKCAECEAGEPLDAYGFHHRPAPEATPCEHPPNQIAQSWSQPGAPFVCGKCDAEWTDNGEGWTLPRAPGGGRDHE